MRKSTERITLTLLATVSVLAVAGCDDRKAQARRDNACRVDPRSEDCQSGGRSHSSAAYWFFGQQPYGQPSYAHSTPTASSYAARPAPAASATTETPAEAVSVARGGFGESAAAHAGGGE